MIEVKECGYREDFELKMNDEAEEICENYYSGFIELTDTSLHS